MSFSSLLDHTARIWRLTETDGTYGETVNAYSIAYPSVRCTLRRKRAVLADSGPGLVATGERTVYFMPRVRFQERDLIELTTGPDAPAFLEVESWAKPRGHHIEVRGSEFRGNPPEVSS